MHRLEGASLLRNQAGRIQLSKLCGRKELVWLKENKQRIGKSGENKPANVGSLYYVHMYIYIYISISIYHVTVHNTQFLPIIHNLNLIMRKKEINPNSAKQLICNL